MAVDKLQDKVPLLLRIIDLEIKNNNKEEARKLLEEAKQVAEGMKADKLRDKVALLLQIAGLEIRNNNKEGAQELLKRAEQVANGVAYEPRNKVDLLVKIAKLQVESGNEIKSQELLEEANQIVEKMDGNENKVSSLIDIAELQNKDEAQKTLKEALGDAKKIKIERHKNQYLKKIAELQFKKGLMGDGKKTMQELGKGFQDSSSWLLETAELQSENGDKKGLKETLDELMGLAIRSGREDKVRVLTTVAILQAKNGDIIEAKRTIIANLEPLDQGKAMQEMIISLISSEKK